MAEDEDEDGAAQAPEVEKVVETVAAVAKAKAAERARRHRLALKSRARVPKSSRDAGRDWVTTPQRGRQACAYGSGAKGPATIHRHAPSRTTRRSHWKNGRKS